MAVSTALSIAGAGAGTRFSGDFQKLGRVETRLSQKPRKHSGWLCLYRHQLPHYYKCFWQESRTEKLSFKQSLALRKDSDDSFLSVGKVLKLFSFLADSIDMLDVGMYEEAWQMRFNE
ncbi:hypothetical protein D5086_022526 [Populus alba]|uniref:Uncharacterized protein n=1 Tax=Populus alba TaxID=43335 RepID=A0ACC4BF84_POPAL